MTIEAAGLPTIRQVADAGRPDPAREAADRLTRAIAARDYGGIFGALARDARLRYIVPSGPGQAVGAADVAARYFGWFGDAVDVEVQESLVQRISDRTSSRYRFLLREGPDWEVVEQQAYLDVDADGRIAAIDLLCSGFRPADDPAGTSADPGGPADASSAPGATTHTLDTGAMGCADGLASEFRRRIGAIPVGDALVVTARDPAAKEDLPPLARLMGHTVRSVEAPGDGRLVITVERGR